MPIASRFLIRPENDVWIALHVQYIHLHFALMKRKFRITCVSLQSFQKVCQSYKFLNLELFGTT